MPLYFLQEPSNSQVLHAVETDNHDKAIMHFVTKDLELEHEYRIIYNGMSMGDTYYLLTVHEDGDWSVEYVDSEQEDYYVERLIA